MVRPRRTQLEGRPEQPGRDLVDEHAVDDAVGPFTRALSKKRGGAIDGGVFGKYTGRQSDIATAETPTAGFTSIDAQLGWRALEAHPGFEVALIGRNLTDSIQRNAVALNKDEVIMPGRDVRLVMRAQF